MVFLESFSWALSLSLCLTHTHTHTHTPLEYQRSLYPSTLFLAHTHTSTHSHTNSLFFPLFLSFHSPLPPFVTYPLSFKLSVSRLSFLCLFSSLRLCTFKANTFLSFYLFVPEAFLLSYVVVGVQVVEKRIVDPRAQVQFQLEISSFLHLV